MTQQSSKNCILVICILFMTVVRILCTVRLRHSVELHHDCALQLELEREPCASGPSCPLAQTICLDLIADGCICRLFWGQYDQFQSRSEALCMQLCTACSGCLGKQTCCLQVCSSRLQCSSTVLADCSLSETTMPICIAPLITGWRRELRNCCDLPTAFPV